MKLTNQTNSKEPIIKRYFSSETILNNVIEDFEFLIDTIIDSGFEYDLQIRADYFNLYYRGNSLAKVTPKPDHNYEICIHEKFFSIDEKDNLETIKKDISERFKRFNPQQKSHYIYFDITKNLLRPFFQIKHLKEFASNIKKVNYQEEITFEQMLITDNTNRQDFIIIDRQVSDSTSKQRMDLLALIQDKRNDYQFCVIEVKLGNNPELNPERRQNVITQLWDYVDRIKTNFSVYKECYKKTVRQKQALRLINDNFKINIVEGVSGIVIIGGYSGIVKKEKYIEKLQLNAPPNIEILPMDNLIDLSKTVKRGH